MFHFCFITGLYSRYDVLMFERQGKSLVKAGFKVTYVVCDNKPDEVLDGVNIVSTNFTPKNRMERFLKTKSVLYDYTKRVDADIYQISDPELIILGYRLKKLGKKVVFNMREYYPDMIENKKYIPKMLRKGCARGYGLLSKKYLKQYDAVFVVTPWIENILKNEYNLTNTSILTNYPNIHHDFSVTYEEYENRGNVLCYEGTIYACSRQENVFSALANLPTVKYILAGKIDEGYNWIKELPYWSQVRFVDGFKYEELPMIFEASTISNVFRDFGNKDGSLGVIKIFESMEAGLPVILSDVPLYRSIVDKYQCGICVNPNDTNSIESAIRYLIEHKHDAYQMGQNGRRAVLEEYNWDKQFENYQKTINTILNA